MSDEHAIRINDDDTVHIGNTGMVTSGRVLRLVSEDMFSWSVEQYIEDARLGRAMRKQRQNARRNPDAIDPSLLVRND